MNELTKATLLYYERMTNTKYGTPRYMLVFQNNETRVGMVTSNGTGNIYAFNPNYNSMYHVKYHTTKSGKNKCDYIGQV